MRHPATPEAGYPGVVSAECFFGFGRDPHHQVREGLSDSTDPSHILSVIQADHRHDSLDEYDEYIAMDGGVHAIEPEMWPC
jgi:hypothetical protein